MYELCSFIDVDMYLLKVQMVKYTRLLSCAVKLMSCAVNYPGHAIEVWMVTLIVATTVPK